VTRHFWASPWKLAMLLIGASVLSLAAALFAIDRVGESIIDAQASAAAAAEQSYMITLAREEGLAALVATLNRRERLHGGAGFHYALTDPAGHAIAGASDFEGTRNQTQGWKVVVSQDRGKQKVWHVLVGALPTGQSLYIAQDSEQRAAFRHAIIQASAIALIFECLACVAAGLLLSGYLLRRAGNIRRTAEQIAAGNLDARIEVTPGGDVFDRLGAALNAMLSRIEELMTGMRTITDSLDHDLRRPLTYVQYALDRAASPDVSERERQDAIAEAKQHNESALSTFGALLDVARAEAGLSAETMCDVGVSTLLMDVAELFEPMFEDARQKLVLVLPEHDSPLRAHELLLRQAVGNLLHNPASHAGEGAVITLSQVPADNGVDIIVADTGPGIPEGDRGRVQQRFVKLDSARSMPGSGLGLAIAAACAKLHGGSLVLEDNAPGLRAILQLRPQE
jgi:signal transduction histidine kinase